MNRECHFITDIIIPVFADIKEYCIIQLVCFDYCSLIFLYNVYDIYVIETTETHIIKAIISLL